MTHLVKYLWTANADLLRNSRFIFFIHSSWSSFSLPRWIHFPERWIHCFLWISFVSWTTSGRGVRATGEGTITFSRTGSGGVFTGPDTESTVTDRLGARQVIQVFKVFPFFKKSETNFCLLHAVHLIRSMVSSLKYLNRDQFYRFTAFRMASLRKSKGFLNRTCLDRFIRLIDLRRIPFLPLLLRFDRILLDRTLDLRFEGIYI